MTIATCYAHSDPSPRCRSCRMSIVATCFVHSDYPRENCPGCQSARNSAFLRMVREARKGTPTPEEQAKLEKVAARWADKDMSRDGRAYSLTELLDDIGLSMAEWYGDKGKDAEPMPKIDTAYIVLLRPDSPPELIPHSITDADREHFKYLVETYHRVRGWARQFAPTVLKEEQAA